MSRPSSYPPARDATIGVFDGPATPKGAAHAPVVRLDPDHPGFRDAAYRRRRNEIAKVALDHTPGAPVPDVVFLPEEHAVWEQVWRELDPLHERHACSEFLQARKRLSFSATRIPQLGEVNQMLQELGGKAGAMQLIPVAGLVSSRAFLGHLSDGYFLSTQYIRHHSVPLYTPEPDIVHELIGHATSFAHPDFVELNEAFGRATLDASDERLQQLAYLYWWTLEFGVVQEGSAQKAYGAGLLSSFGELRRLTETPTTPLDCNKAAQTPYDPTTYQPSLFVAGSFAELKQQLLDYL